MTPVRVAFAAAAWLAIFALVFSVGVALDVWPKPPEGFLHGSDQVAGLVFGAGLLVAFLRPRRPGAVG
jgi:hypothetical protein